MNFNQTYIDRVISCGQDLQETRDPKSKFQFVTTKLAKFEHNVRVLVNNGQGKILLSEGDIWVPSYEDLDALCRKYAESQVFSGDADEDKFNPLVIDSIVYNTRIAAILFEEKDSCEAYLDQIMLLAGKDWDNMLKEYVTVE